MQLNSNRGPSRTIPSIVWYFLAWLDPYKYKYKYKHTASNSSRSKWSLCECESWPAIPGVAVQLCLRGRHKFDLDDPSKLCKLCNCVSRAKFNLDDPSKCNCGQTCSILQMVSNQADLSRNCCLDNSQQCNGNQLKWPKQRNNGDKQTNNGILQSTWPYHLCHCNLGFCHILQKPR